MNAKKTLYLYEEKHLPPRLAAAYMYMKKLFIPELMLMANWNLHVLSKCVFL